MNIRTRRSCFQFPAFLFLALLAPGLCPAQTVLLQDFPPSAQFPGSAAKWHAYAGTRLAVEPNALTMSDATGSGGPRAAEVAFDPLSLPVGGYIKLSLSIKIVESHGNNGSVRIGLYHSGNLTLENNTQSSVESFDGRPGYFLILDTRTDGATGSADLKKTARDQNLFMIVEGNSVGTFKNLHRFGTDWAEIQWRIERSGENEFVHSISVNKGRPQTLLCSTGPGDGKSVFDTFLLFSRGSASFSIRSLRIETTQDP